MAALLKNVDWRPSLSGAFRAGRRPQEVLLRVVDCSLSQVLLSSSRVDLVLQETPQQEVEKSIEGSTAVDQGILGYHSSLVVSIFCTSGTFVVLQSTLS